MTDNLIPINIVIADRNYRIKINPSDEEVVRKTLKTINEKIIEYKTQFAGQDMQDYVAMVLVWFATQVNSQNGGWQHDGIQQQIDQLETLLNSQ